MNLWKKFVTKWLRRMTLCEIGFELLQHGIRERYYDLRVNPLYYNPRKNVCRSENWSRKYAGLYRIVKELSPVIMLLQAPKGMKPFVSHVDKLNLLKAL